MTWTAFKAKVKSYRHLTGRKPLSELLGSTHMHFLVSELSLPLDATGLYSDDEWFAKVIPLYDAVRPKIPALLQKIAMKVSKVFDQSLCEDYYSSFKVMMQTHADVFDDVAEAVMVDHFISHLQPPSFVELVKTTGPKTFDRLKRVLQDGYIEAAAAAAWATLLPETRPVRERPKAIPHPGTDLRDRKAKGDPSKLQCFNCRYCAEKDTFTAQHPIVICPDLDYCFRCFQEGANPNHMPMGSQCPHFNKRLFDPARVVQPPKNTWRVEGFNRRLVRHGRLARLHRSRPRTSSRLPTSSLRHAHRRRRDLLDRPSPKPTLRSTKHSPLSSRDR